MIGYKLTDTNIRTRFTQWTIGVPVIIDEENNNSNLCSSGWIHFYTDPVIGLLMNPVHADFNPARLWECEYDGEVLHEPLKSGCKKLTLIKELPVPTISLINRVTFAILCTKEVYKEKKWNNWAEKWLNGEDRTYAAAAYAANTAYAYAAYAAANATANATANTAAYAANYAANVAVYTANAADTYVYAANAAVYVANHTSKLSNAYFINLAHKSLTIN